MATYDASGAITVAGAQATSLTIGRAGFAAAVPGAIRYLPASAPATPASGLSMYADVSGRLSWLNTNGFSLSLSSTMSANRTYVIPDAAGLFPQFVLHNATQTLTNKTIVDPTNTVEASQLRTVTTPVNLATGTPPLAGMGLLAFSTSTASWSYMPPFAAMFGTGVDLSATIAANTTMTRDMYYEDLTVNVGATLNTGGYRVFVSDTLTLNGNISYNGNSGTTGGLGGLALTANTVGGGSAGGTSGNAGSNGGNAGAAAANTSMGAIGGSGGQGGGGVGSGLPGLPGAISVVPAANGGTQVFNDIMRAILGRDVTGTRLTGGTGGGGGGGSATGGGGVKGGGGGGGGGVVIVCARTVTGSGAITANGGAGAAGANGGNQGGGGGGGGGGGVVVLVRCAGDAILQAQSGAGGAGGTGTSPGFAGAGGSLGQTYKF